MPTQQKIDTTEELASILGDSKGTVVVDYRGLNVSDISTLRRHLREQAVEFRVAKNTLLRRAAKAATLDVDDSLFTGPTAIVTSEQDEVAPARLMAEAARVPRTPLSIKGGIYGSRAVSADEIRAIAELPPRETLLARVLGVVQAPASALLSVAQAPARQILYAMNAYELSEPQQAAASAQ